jgi:uncharacterized protein
MENGSSAPDYVSGITCALQMLRTQLPAQFSYHCAEHTELDVIPAVIRLAELSGVSARECLQLQVAAAFHDLGYIQSTVDHEAIGIRRMYELLPGFGFAIREIDTLAALVQATRMPQSPRSRLEAILADADLDSLGRDDFLNMSEALWRERVALGDAISWSRWLQLQLQFLQTHRYFTAEAQALRDAGKQRNIELLRQLSSTQLSSVSRART